MRLPDGLARFNRYVTNPIQRLWAGRLPLFAIVEHTGRRSGRTYRTPVNLFGVPGGFAIVLTYGRERDWVRNVLAAGGGTLIHRGRRIGFTDPVVLPSEEAQDFLTALPRALLRFARFEHVMRVRTG